MKDYIYRVTLKLQAPIVSKGIGGRRMGLDAVWLRNGEQRPALPGNLVRGHLREAWNLFSAPSINALSRTDLIRWLGRDHQDSEPEDDDEKEKKARLLGRLRFADFWVADDAGNPDGLRHRIRIDPDTGAVASGALLFIESPYAPGTEVRFQGDIEVVLDDPEEAEHLRSWLKKGFNYLQAVGGLKGVGFGKVIAAEVEKPEPRVAPPPSKLNPERRPGSNGAVTLGIGVAIHPEGLICFPRPAGDKNRIVSEDHIPGAAIKAAMAHRKDKFPLVDEYFDTLRVTHALPVPIGQHERPLAMPCSLAFGPKGEGETVGKLYDLALKQRPGLLSGQAPLFQPDWKEKHRRAASITCGRGASPDRRLMVRNAIDYDTGTVLYEKESGGGSLYTIEALVPERHQWLANLHIPDVPEDKVENLLNKLAELFALDLVPLGRTHTRACMKPLGQGIYPMTGCCGPLIRLDGRLVIALQSLALLLPEDFHPAPTNDGDTLLNQYRESWKQLSANSIQLDWFYARQTLIGGKYWKKRFRDKHDPYRPLVATLPGSVFVCRVVPGKEKEAERYLKRWRDLGLPQLKGIPGGEDWQKNPWLAQNGYGEVAINPPLHWEMAPPEGVWDEQ